MIFEDGAYQLSLTPLKVENGGNGTWETQYRITMQNRGPNARHVRAVLLNFSPKIRLSQSFFQLGDIAAGQSADASETLQVTTTDSNLFAPPWIRWQVSGGVVLQGDADSLARNALVPISAVEVHPKNVIDGLIRRQLVALIDPDATVSQVNQALASVEGRIVTSLPPALGVVIGLPHTLEPLQLADAAEKLAKHSGFTHAEPARVAQSFELPASGQSDHANVDHLFPTRYAAAWNVAGLVDPSACQKVTALVLDHFAAHHSVEPQLELLTHDSSPSSSNSPHGWIVAAVLGAKFDENVPTGAARLHKCIEIYAAHSTELPELGSGLRYRILVNILADLADPNPLRKRIIANNSIGPRFAKGCFECDANCTANGSCAGYPYRQANWALVWWSWNHDATDRVFLASAAGNEGRSPCTSHYPGFGFAGATMLQNMVAMPKGPIGLAARADLWDAQVSPADPLSDITATTEEISGLELRRTLYGLDGVAPADNTLIVGAANSPLFDSPDLIGFASFSDRARVSPRDPHEGPVVYVVGEDIIGCDTNQPDCVTPPLPPCGSSGDPPPQQSLGFRGTSFAAPQVAGLAAYLWLISDAISPDPLTSLRAQSPKVTRDLIIATSRKVGSVDHLVDAYAAVLALDAPAPANALNSPIRRQLLDVAMPYGVFDDNDIKDFSRFLFETDSSGGFILDAEGRPVERHPNDRDYSRYDLNGDGFTGGRNIAPFDLDPTRAAPLSGPKYQEVSILAGDRKLHFDERAVTDLGVLCYYAYSDLFDTSAGTASRDAIGCLGIHYSVIERTHPGVNNPPVHMGRGPSINNSGEIAFIRRIATNTPPIGDQILVKRSHDVLLGVYNENPHFHLDDDVQINDAGKVVWRSRSYDGLLDFINRLDRDTVDGYGTLIAAGSRTPVWESVYDEVQQAPTLANDGRVVFAAASQSLWRLASRSDGQSPYDQSSALPSDTAVFPMTADNGATIVRWGANQTSPLWLFTRDDLGAAGSFEIGDEYNRFGKRPGIDDAGRMIVFMAVPVSGSGVVFMREVRSLLPPEVGANFEIANLNDFDGFWLSTRVGVNRLGLSSDYRIVFTGGHNDTAGNAVPGLYAVDVHWEDPVSKSAPICLLKKGQSLPTLTGEIDQFVINDPVNTQGDVVAWVMMNNEIEAVIKITIDTP